MTTPRRDTALFTGFVCWVLALAIVIARPSDAGLVLAALVSVALCFNFSAWRRLR